uniref:Uncharacterized protein n=1 Tax=Eptatretus burgeri TaxID=7764 RepID=A0A8C4QMU6_EPTBU
MHNSSFPFACTCAVNVAVMVVTCCNADVVGSLASMSFSFLFSRSSRSSSFSGSSRSQSRRPSHSGSSFSSNSSRSSASPSPSRSRSFSPSSSRSITPPRTRTIKGKRQEGPPGAGEAKRALPSGKVSPPAVKKPPSAALRQPPAGQPSASGVQKGAALAAKVAAEARPAPPVPSEEGRPTKGNTDPLTKAADVVPPAQPSDKAEVRDGRAKERGSPGRSPPKRYGKVEWTNQKQPQRVVQRGGSHSSESVSSSGSHSHHHSHSSSASHSGSKHSRPGPEWNQLNRSLSMSSVSSASSASSHSSVHSADSDNMYADLASPVSSASEPSPPPRSRGKAKKETPLPPPKNKEATKGKEVNKEKALIKERDKVMVREKESAREKETPKEKHRAAGSPFRPHSQRPQGSPAASHAASGKPVVTMIPLATGLPQGKPPIVGHKEIKITLLNKGPEKEHRKRLEPLDRERGRSPPLKKVAASPERGYKERRPPVRITSPVRPDRHAGHRPPSPKASASLADGLLAHSCFLICSFFSSFTSV